MDIVVSACAGLLGLFAFTSGLIVLRKSREVVDLDQRAEDRATGQNTPGKAALLFIIAAMLVFIAVLFIVKL